MSETYTGDLIVRTVDSLLQALDEAFANCGHCRRRLASFTCLMVTFKYVVTPPDHVSVCVCRCVCMHAFQHAHTDAHMATVLQIMDGEKLGINSYQWRTGKLSA